MHIYNNISLLKYNTFGIDAMAECFVEYSGEGELLQLLRDMNLPKPLYFLGAGSNTLFTEKVVKGTILHSLIKGFDIISQDEHSLLVRVGSGVIWDDFVLWAVEHNLYGVENLSYIPGTVGASAVQNVGAYGAEAADVIYRVECLNVETLHCEVFDKQQLNYGYRESAFKHELKDKYIVTAVQYQLQKQGTFRLDYGNLRASLANEQITLQKVREKVIEIRRSKLPEVEQLGSAGSFFKNPVIERAHYQTLLKENPTMPHYDVDEQRVKVPAAWLIDSCGFKGYRHGGAMVYEKQPLVIVNFDNATASDVISLAQEIQLVVNQRFGIVITPEVVYKG